MGVAYPWVSDDRAVPFEGWGAGVANADAPDGGSGPGYSRPYAKPICVQVVYGRSKPRLIAEAREKIDKVLGAVSVKCADSAQRDLPFGQDITHGTGGKLPYGSEVPRNGNEAYEMTLRKTIGVLAKSFDTTGKAQREFDAFLNKSGQPKLYTDPELDKTIAADENFVAFSEYTVNDPKGRHFNPAALRIHQALQSVNWDINQVIAIADLRTLAFDRGSALFKSDNYGDGLKIMINAVNHVLVFVDEYHYDSCAQRYDISLTFELYDSFGLDDEDVEKFGYKAQLQNQFNENLGFTAWWQLQHQFGYAPLVTKAVVKKQFSVSTRP